MHEYSNLFFSNRDQYGFKRPVKWIEPKLLQAFDIEYKNTLRKQTKNWNKLFDNNDRQWPTLCSECKIIHK